MGNKTKTYAEKRILKKEFNITGISTHNLRHTFGTKVKLCDNE